MYDARIAPRRADRTMGIPARNEAVERALMSLSRVRSLLNSFVPGMAPDRDLLLQRLETPLTDAAADRERKTLRGWLLWLTEQWDAANLLLLEAVEACKEADDKPTLGVAAYWLARVRLRLQIEAIRPYEIALRKLGGSPQATAGFVDLLWRAGRTERAEQVWKSVRGNKRVAACPEGQLLEARLHLQRGEWNAAKKLLEDWRPSNGPLLAEVHLLLAWMYTSQNKAADASVELEAAALCPYPASALAAWRGAIERFPLVALTKLPRAWESFLEAQRRRAAGEQPIDTYRELTEAGALAPLARYGLVILGAESAGDVLPGVTSPFWGMRLRAYAAVERFARREITPPALLETLAAVARAEYACPALEHFKRLAEADYRDATGPEGPMRENALLLMLEQGLALPTEGLPARIRDEIERRELHAALETNDPQRAEGLQHPLAGFFRATWPDLVPQYPTLAAMLAAHSAAQRGDVNEAVEAFRTLESPPAFVVRAMQALWLHRPTDPALLELGLHTPREAPPAWWSHRAARALAQRDYTAAQLALAETTEPVRVPVARLAEAQRIAAAFPEAGLAAERLLPLVETLEAEGIALGESPRQTLAGITAGPVALRHPLAILFWRGLKAEALDGADAERAWGHWLACEPPAGVIEHLLEWHRQAIVDCLSRGLPESARKHWDTLHRLPALSERLARFRDTLATHFLVHTREVMRHAQAPEGLSADYERGLSLLRRMLSLDRDNLRLLVALIEICNDWFLDCYNAEEFGTLRDLVQRHRPFAEHLYRLIGERPGEIAARNVLSDFWKARGFTESERDKRAGYYREALKLNPNNENVQQLLADMEEGTQDDA
jgi:hypothetical protein